MNRPEMEFKIKEIIYERLGIKESNILTSSLLVEDMGANSLDLVEMVLSLEECFDIEIKDEELEKIKTIQDGIDIVATKKLDLSRY